MINELSPIARRVGLIMRRATVRQPEDLVEDTVGLLQEHPSEALLLLWASARTIQSCPVALRRIIAFGTTSPEAEPVCRLPVLHDLTSEPYPTDPASLINTATGMAALFRTLPVSALSFRFGLASFLRHCLSQSSIVQEAALDFMVEATERKWLTLSEAQARILLKAISRIDPASIGPHAEDLTFLRGALREAQVSEFENSSKEIRAAHASLSAWALHAAPETAAKLIQSSVAYLQDRLLFVDTAEASVRLGLPIHHLRIWAETAKNLSIARVVALSDAWDGLLGAVAGAIDLEGGWFAVEGAQGSLVLRIAVEGPNGPRLLDEIRQLFKADSQESLLPLLERLALPVSEYEELLSPLIEGNVSLEVSGYDPNEDAFQDVLAIKRKAAMSFSKIANELPNARVTSADVPQADDIHRVLRLIEISNRQEEITPEALDVTPRQVNYYKQAARVLGFLDARNRLTPAGEQVCRLTGDDRLSFVCASFESSRFGLEWLRWSKAQTLADLEASTAERFLNESSIGLNATTIKRRAQTLVSWQQALAPYRRAHAEHGNPRP
jgi:hypothetical protein